MAENYNRYREPKSIIEYTVRHHYLYKFSLRDVSEMLMEQGPKVPYETIRK